MTAQLMFISIFINTSKVVIFVKVGVVLLYLNYSTLQYEEKLTLELNNLTVKCKRDLIKNNAVHLQLDKYSQLFVYLEVEAPHLPFDYKL